MCRFVVSIWGAEGSLWTLRDAGPGRVGRVACFHCPLGGRTGLGAPRLSRRGGGGWVKPGVGCHAETSLELFLSMTDCRESWRGSRGRRAAGVEDPHGALLLVLYVVLFEPFCNEASKGSVPAVVTRHRGAALAIRFEHNRSSEHIPWPEISEMRTGMVSRSLAGWPGSTEKVKCHRQFHGGHVVFDQ
ncbi:hypothetical protein BC834DRAFT_59555 [Gloeopeniophorella convolvens]|nr:hypothetical protein BC834DRAFT_59555 [Gloeopeniophorella convolvens]